MMDSIYLTGVILHRLPREGCTFFVLELSHMVVKRRHCYVKVTSTYHVASTYGSHFLNIKVDFNGEQENLSIIRMMVG